MKTLLLFFLSALCIDGAELASKKHIRYQKTPGASPIRQILDVHYDAKTIGKAKPVILWIHGGAWKFGNKTHSIESKANAFISEGYVLVAMNYRFHPKVSWKEQAGDVSAAAKWIQDNIQSYGGDPKRLVLMGHSAGAHLAALAGADPSHLKKAGVPYYHIKCVVLLDGAGYDLPSVMKTAKGKYLELYKEVFGNEPAQLKAASPTHQFGKKRPAPAYLIIPISRREITQQQSNDLAKAIKQSGNHAEVFVARNRTHMTLNKRIGSPGDTPTKAIFDFLNKRLPKD
ncbi:MAG: alpha/beta hydrolase [Akkermansiaceae bacterium]